MAHHTVACLAFTLVVFIGTLNGLKIQVFEDVYFEGESKVLLPFKACLDLNGMWDNRISSVRVHGGCIILCEDKRCKGRCEKIFPGTNAHQDFTMLGVNDRISSYKNCESPNDNDIPNR